MSKDLYPPTISLLYTYFLRPKLEYASPVWHGNLLEQDALALERVQSAVARAVLRAPFRTPKSELFERLDWPSLRWRREIASMVLFHRILHTRPKPLDACLFKFAHTVSDRSLRKPKQLLLQEAHTTKYINTFFYRTSMIWNTLPAQIQNISNHHHFKDALEAHWSIHKYSTRFTLI